VTGGPNGRSLVHPTNGNGSSNLVIVWDHRRAPGCATSTLASPRGPWQPYVNDADTTHYPVRRHDGGFHLLFCDGHVNPTRQAELLDALVYACGP
jgi:prepilin-type processing-associated H-X9-DG protein